MDLPELNPMEWVQAFQSVSIISKVAFWFFVVAVAARIGGESIAKIIRALLCKRE